MARQNSKTDQTKSEPAPASSEQQDNGPRPVAIVSAPSGRRRRGGLSFTNVDRVLTEADLGDDPEATLKLLMDDPALSVRPADPDAEQG